jgi:hypothetical protein
MKKAHNLVTWIPDLIVTKISCIPAYVGEYEDSL